MPEKILVLVEGISKEMAFFDSFNRNFIGWKHNVQLVPFGCNIYSLFQEMKEYDFDIDLEKEIALSPSISKEQKEKLKGMKFPTKYLVFDFDFQERTMTEQEKYDALIQMLQVFDNDSENGLLLLNYPMFESFQEKISSKKQMESCCVPFEEFSHYKDLIFKRKLVKDCNNLKHEDFSAMILMTLKESNYILNGKFSKKISFSQLIDFHYESELLLRQKEKLQKENLIYPINTSVLIPLFFFGITKYNSIS